MNADDDRDGARRKRASPEDEGPADSGPPNENTLGRKFAWPEFAWPEVAGKSPDILGFGESANTSPDDEPEIPQPRPAPTGAPPAERYLGEFAQDRRYRGLRRADRLTDRHWPVIGAALAAVSVALAVLIIVASMPVRRNTTAPPGGAGAPGMSVPANVPQSTAPTASPSAPIATSPAPTKKGAPPPPKAPPSQAGMRATTYEAEQPGNLISGTAAVVDYPGASGGRIVRNIGNWDDPAGPGTLTFTHVTVPASGVYVMRFFYVHLDNQANRTVVITIATVGTFQMTVTGSSVCCASKAVAIPLQKGTNPITFSNPDGHAPSLDKIVISTL